MRVIVERGSQGLSWIISMKKTKDILETNIEKVYLKNCKFNTQGKDTIEGDLITKDEAYTRMSCILPPKAISRDPHTGGFLVCDFEKGLEPITEAPMLFLDELIMLVEDKSNENCK